LIDQRPGAVVLGNVGYWQAMVKQVVATRQMVVAEVRSKTRFREPAGADGAGSGCGRGGGVGVADCYRPVGLCMRRSGRRRSGNR
jgi:hypothetical protein